MKKVVFTLLTLILICSGCGMAALSYYITPADIDKASVEYVTETGGADANEFKGYPNLVKAQKLEKAVDAGHNMKQLDLQQQIQQDNLVYSIHKDVVSNNVTAGLQREESLFGPQGLLSMGLSMIGMGGLAGFVGLMRKRPGDITKDEADAAIAQATGESQDEVAAKTKQFYQVVQGVSEFKKSLEKRGFSSSPANIVDILDDMKQIFNAAQDSDTQIAVETAKKG